MGRTIPEPASAGSGYLRTLALSRSPPSAPHVAFALPFGPGQHVFHFVALRIFQAHLGLDRLGINLLGDLGRRRRRRDRQGLVIVWIWIAEECALRWTFLGPGFERRQLCECRQ